MRTETGVRQLFCAQRSRIGGDDEEVMILRGLAVLVGLLAKLNVHEPAGKRSARAGDFDALATQSLVDGDGGRIMP